MAGFGGLFGIIGGLVYLLALRVLPSSTPLRMALFGLLGGSLGGAAFVHSYSSFDYSELDPVWLAVSAFIVMPTLFGVLVPAVDERLLRPDSWMRNRASLWIVVMIGLFIAGFALPIVGFAVGAAMLVQTSPRLLRWWGTQTVTVLAVILFIAAVLLGLVDVVADIQSIAAQEPGGCRVCLGD